MKKVEWMKWLLAVVVTVMMIACAEDETLPGDQQVALNLIVAYAEDNSSTRPTAEDYQKAGIDLKDIDANALSDYLASLHTSGLDKADIEEIIDNFDALAAGRDDNGSVAGSEEIYRSGTDYKIKGTWQWDIDTGETDGDADFHWRVLNEEGEQYLTPKNGAEFAVVTDVDYADIDKEYIVGVSLSPDPINGAYNDDTLVAGSILVFKTSEGRFGKFLITEFEDYDTGYIVYRNYNMIVDWVLYK